MTNKYSKEIAKTVKNVEKMHEDGLYPKSFSLPIGLQYELTSKCNLTCKHCYNRSGDADKETLMGVDDWISLSNEIVENGGIFQCIISGGEPLLLGDDMFRIMDVFHRDNTPFILISNGMLLTKEIAKKLSKYNFFRVQISIDGSQESFHDGFRQKNGSWMKAVEAAHYISGYGMPLTIASSVVPGNVDKIEDMAKLAYQLGASSIIFGEVMLSGRASEYQDSLFLDDSMKKIMTSTINTITKQYHGKMSVNFGSSEESQLVLNQIYPTDTVIIRPNGDVRLDCTAPFTMGNVLEQPFCDIWEKKSRDIWHRDEVVNYINNVKNKDFINHVDVDIAL